MKFLFIFLSLFISTLLFSQAPEGINYQAVMRNNSGNLVTNSTVAIRVQVRQVNASGATIYQERHSISTSSQGLINMVIGGGTPQVGTFNGINWVNGPFFVNLAVDFTNGTNYQDFGTQQLMSVPYALYAKSSGNQLNQWRYGNTAPPSSLGNFGDFYLDVITGNVYYKNNNTTWVLTGNIKGPVGPTGVAGAQGPQGIQGVAGTNGTNGSNGTNGADGKNTLVKTTTEAAGTNCTTGGVKIEYGLDANSNGTLDLSEINASLTKFVCNGTVGATGAQGPQGIQGVAGPTGATGVQGPIGLTGPAGATGAQGIQGPAGTNGTNGSNGTNGTDGKNTLVKTTTEAAGANCTTDGVKIEYGLDANSNGTLDLSEINASLTKYVCNGAVGATGLQGPAGVAGAQGPQGIQGTAGTNGTNGLNALINTTTEPAGANCTNGGTKIETGLDANANGVLDASEVNASQTQYVCNGGGSINVSGSGQGFNSNHGLMNILSDTILVANQSKLVEVILRGGNGGSGGYSGSICPGGSGGWGGGSGGTGAGIRFLLNVATGDTLDIKKGIDGLNGCSTCIYTGVCNCCYAGQSGTAGTSSKISINSLTSSNFIFEAHGGGEGGAQWGSLAGSGANGSLITGNQYNSVGAFILESNLNGQGAAVILRW